MNGEQEESKIEDSINLNDDEEEDDSSTITITLLSEQTIDIDYSQLFKYSQLVKDKYPFEDAKRGLFSNFFKIQQQKYNIDEKNIFLFFLLIKEKNVSLNIDNIIDFWKLSIILQVKRLKMLILKFIKKHSDDTDLMSKLLNEQLSAKNDDIFELNNLMTDIELKLSGKIEECFKSKNFGKLPISTIHRVIDRCDKNKLSSDLLYDFIKKSIEERYVLFSFIDIKSLSDENFKELAQQLREKNHQNFYDYFKTDFGFIDSLKTEKYELEQKIEDLLNENQHLDMKVNDLINLNSNLQDQIKTEKEDKEKILDEKNKISTENDLNKSLLTKKSESEKNLEKYQNILENYEKIIKQLNLTEANFTELKDDKGILKYKNHFIILY